MLRCDAKSLALFRAIQRKIAASGDPLAHVRKARDWAARFSGQRPEDIWLAEWVVRLDAVLRVPKKLPKLYALMLSEEQHAIDMRSSSPFPGVLTTKERTEVLRAFEREWRDQREGVS